MEPLAAAEEEDEETANEQEPSILHVLNEDWVLSVLVVQIVIFVSVFDFLLWVQRV
jgi:hypothetical protein